MKKNATRLGKSPLLFLSLLVAGLGAHAQFMGWEGDWRVGLTGNIAYQLSTPKANLGDYLSTVGAESGLAYGGGIYVGMQKDMGNSQWAWGLDGTLTAMPADWTASFKSNHFPNETYTYDMRQLQYTGVLQAHAAYFLGHSLQVQGGCGPYVQLVAQQVCAIHTAAPNGLTYPVAQDPVKGTFAGSLGAAASLGFTYYIVNHLFVKGDCYFFLPLYKKDGFSTSVFTDPHYRISYAEDGYMAATFGLTIGYLW